jgi:peptide deformylase
MLLPIYVYGHPVLRKVAEDITADYPDLLQLLENLWQTMYESDGIGLAAPQIGKNIRIFVVDASMFEEQDPLCKDFKQTFINAHILERSGEEVLRNEGCLSIPGIHEDVLRNDRIKIAYKDENGGDHVEVFEGMRARIIQHEYDHLDGKLFTDHLSVLKKRLLKSKLNNISAGKFSVNYRVVLPK